ncbi:MAG: NAD-binding protein [Gorillibacterium sp.]|nr:NAD-binding protein [Gorillibacterium sp.]
MKRVGFIGLGTMGKPMALNLLKEGYTLTVFNRTSSKVDELVEAGARSAESPAEVARESDVVITIVKDDAALLDIILGINGVIDGARPGLTVIDCSTVAPETSRRVASALAHSSVQFIDAPVGGSKPAAENGTLVFMVGGDQDVLAEHRDVLEAMGSRYLHMGVTGSGSYTKLAHNLIVGINTAALAEGFAFAARAGIDVNKFLEIIQAGGAASRMADLKGRKIIDHDFEVQFSLQLMLKDLLLAAKETAQFQLPTPLLSGTTSLYQMSLAKGNGDLDLSSVVSCYEDWIGSIIGSTPPHPIAQTETGEGPLEQEEGSRDRRRADRVSLGIKLQMSVYQWQAEGAFSGQNFQVTLQDLSGDGLQIVTKYRLAEDMFVVIHFPKSSFVPPVTAKIIRIERDVDDYFRYGCMMSGLSPVIKIRLDEYIQDVVDGKEK